MARVDTHEKSIDLSAFTRSARACMEETEKLVAADSAILSY